MKSFLFLAICFFLISCQKASDCSTSSTKELKEVVAVSNCDSPSSPASVDPAPFTEGEVPAEAFHFDASIKFTNFEVEQEAKVFKAVEIIKKVIATEEFRSKVLNFSYNGKKGFVDSKLTNEQVYQKLLQGAEDLFPETDYEMDVELELYYSSKNTVGYTYPDSVKIFMNSKYFTPFTTYQVAGNIFHEWTHKLGFKHALTYSVSRDSSVPYALGYLMRDLGQQYE